VGVAQPPAGARRGVLRYAQFDGGDEMRMLRWIAVVTAILVLLEACEIAAGAEVSGLWKFRADPNDEGVRLGWMDPDLDDSAWEELQAGRTWEEQTHPDYDGLGWYRKRISIPPDLAGKDLVLIFPGVDDAYEAWANGAFLGRSGSMSGGASVWQTETMVPLPAKLTTAGEVLVAVRVMDWGGGGGLVRAPIRIEPAPVIEVLDLSGAWKFSTDPEGHGLDLGWHRPDFDDAAWREAQVPAGWEAQIGDYDGWAWYRKKLKLTDTWPEGKGIVVFGGVDDAYELYVNGEKVATHGSLTPAGGENSVYNKTTSTDIGRYCGPGRELTLAVRVMDWYANGGIVQPPAMLVPNPALAGDWGQVLRYLAALHPNWYVPAWVRAGAGVWTVAGLARAREEALVGPDGSVQPQNASYSFTPVLYDVEAGRLLCPEYDFEIETWQNVTWRLRDDALPIVEWRWEAEGGLSLAHDFLVWRDRAGAPTGYSRITVANGGGQRRQLRLYLLVRPYRLNGNVARAERVEVTGTDVTIDGRLFARVSSAPAAYGACNLLDGDPSEWAGRGEVPSGGQGASRGPAAAALAWDLAVEPGQQWTLEVASPQAPGGDFNPLAFSEAEGEGAAWWQDRIGKTRWNLPEPRVANAARANAAYMLVSMDGDQPHPGPLNYDAFWCRDSAYQIAAMLRMGLNEEARAAAEVYVKIQLPDGEFPSIVSGDYRPGGPHEWDAQGQGIYSLVQVYRFTRDRAWLQRVYPALRKACEFLEGVRLANMTEEVRQKPPPLNYAFGILTPSVSAEDLGPGDWHHYWDDFWAVLGWRDAEYAARELGLEDDARWMRTSGDELLASTMESIRQVMAHYGIDYIPNGPEDKDSSSMARGTSPGLWPGMILDPRDPLTLRSFDVYWEKWIAPTGGGYVHWGSVWGYGMELGACYVLLGQRERAWKMLRWHLDHQSAPGVYAWGESFDPKTGRFRGGDMPHTWVGADYLNLLRTCLMYERGEQLMLLAGLPEEWLRGDKTFSVASMPTYWGDLDMTVTPAAAAPDGKVHVRLGGPCNPPGGFVLVLPAGLQGVIER